ncbi:MAG: bestrophin family protein [Crocinitomicaceae bacterium]
MYVDRVFKPTRIILASWLPILSLIGWSSLVVSIYVFAEVKWIAIPWVPLTLVGIAVAFYLGFKNNSAYDRTWEARKIWGEIVNDSRTWGMMITGFVTDEFTKDPHSSDELKEIRKRMIFRHIAWLYRLKRQLRVVKTWEHDKPLNHRYRKIFEDAFPSKEEQEELLDFLKQEEVDYMMSKSNVATQLLKRQSDDLTELKSKGLIDDFRHMELERLLMNFYTHQGKCERIKNFPLPRQYASVSIYFCYIFIFLLPFGLISAFNSFDTQYIWGVVPFTTLIGWIFYMMELVGDYAENPFEALAFDTPMTALTRTIEIDLKEMLDEENIPQAIVPVEGVLM